MKVHIVTLHPIDRQEVIQRVNFTTAVAQMRQSIKHQVEQQVAASNPQLFTDMYCALHYAQLGEYFFVS